MEPSWLATQAAPFVCGESGSLRDLDFILWEFPMTILAQLVHVKLRQHGVWTIEPARNREKAEAIARTISTPPAMQW